MCIRDRCRPYNRRHHMKTTRSLYVIVVILLLVFSTLAVKPAQQHLDVEARVNALLAKMTLEEKLGQLQQLDGEGNGTFRPEHLELARKGLLGSTLNVRGAKQVNQLQHVAVDESRLKIPIPV